jgi:hypothetical protein
MLRALLACERKMCVLRPGPSTTKMAEVMAAKSGPSCPEQKDQKATYSRLKGRQQKEYVSDEKERR